MVFASASGNDYESLKGKMKVIFKLNHAETKMGQTAHLIGGAPQLGGWDPTSAIKMKTAGQLSWQNKEQVLFLNEKEAANIEYKYMITTDDSIDSATLENGDSRKLDLSEFFESGQTVVVEDQEFNRVDEAPMVYTQNQDQESSQDLTRQNQAETLEN